MPERRWDLYVRDATPSSEGVIALGTRKREGRDGSHDDD